MALLAKSWDYFLWWMYRRWEWWRRVIIRRVSFLGWLILIITGLSGIFGTDVVQNALGFTFFFGVVILLVEFISLFFRRVKVEVAFQGIPNGTAFVGQKSNLSFLVDSVTPLRRVRFILYPWSEGLSFLNFREGREPDEEKRNIVDRALKFYRWQWLQSRMAIPFTATASKELWDQEGKSQTLEIPVEFQQRGKWSLVNMRAHLPGVFGLLERSCKTDGSRGFIYVAPRVLPVRISESGGAGREDTMSLETQARAGDSQEFHSLREYHPGDHWRKVNWKAMARTDKAMIQETEEPGVPAYAITWETEGLNSLEFENGAVLVASLVAHFHSLGTIGVLKISHGKEREYLWEDGVTEVYQALAEMKQGELWDEEIHQDLDQSFSHHFLIQKGDDEGERGQTHLNLRGDCVNGEKLEGRIDL